jgi:carbon-monoxide dehydrogenase iron sulfur subunit
MLIGFVAQPLGRMRLLFLVRPVNVERCISCFSCIFACSRRTGHVDIGHAALRVKSTPPPTAGGSGGNYVIIMCRGCSEPICLDACKYDAIRKKKGGGILISAEKCVGCGDCTEACPLSAIFIDESRNKAVVCVHCGECVEWCPHGILVREDVK